LGFLQKKVIYWRAFPSINDWKQPPRLVFLIYFHRFFQQEFQMKTVTQTTAERTQLCKLIEDLSVAMLTTIDADGALSSRPMTPLEMDGDGALWFFTDSRSAKVERLTNAHLSFADEARGTYVSLSGRGEMQMDRAHIERLWTPFAKPWFPDGPDSPNLALLKFVPDTAEYWDAPHSKMVRMFAIAASIVAAKPVGLGDHDTLSDLSAKSTAIQAVD
jgi:general stress protein 26